MTKLNKDYIIYNLEEAKIEIDTILKKLHDDPHYESADLWPVIKHLYHHINTAWNARYASIKETHDYSQDDFIKWRQFPGDIDMN